MTLLLNGMNELASKSTDMTKSSSIVRIIIRVFNLTNEFDNFKNSTFNGKQVFGSGATEESLEFLIPLQVIGSSTENSSAGRIRMDAT